MSVLHNIFFFIIAIGVLVTFHEFGHYWVARKAGVKVLRFSIGFGKPLFSWRRKTPEGDEIDFVIAAIPLGGYVKMLDEREGEVAEEDKSRAFNNQSIEKRIAIVFAGPAFNFILAIFLYWIVFMLGSTVDRPFVGEVDAGSVAAKAGFQVKDEVLKVSDTNIKSWNEFRLEILNHGLNGGNIQVLVRDADGIEKHVSWRWAVCTCWKMKAIFLSALVSINGGRNSNPRSAVSWSRVRPRLPAFVKVMSSCVSMA